MASKILISVDDCAYTPALRAKWGMWNGLADLNEYITYECLLKFVLSNAGFLIQQGVSDQDIGMLPKSALMRRVPSNQIASQLPEADLLIITGYFGNYVDLEVDFSQLAHFQGRVIFFGFGLNQSNDSYESFKRSAQQLKRFGPIYCQDEIVSEVRGHMLDELIAELTRTNQPVNFDLTHKARLLHYPVHHNELAPIMLFEAKKLFAMYVTRAAKVITSAPYVLYLCFALGIPVRYLSDNSADSIAQSALLARLNLSSGEFVKFKTDDRGLYQRQLLLSLIQGNAELAHQASTQLKHLWSQW